MIRTKTRMDKTRMTSNHTPRMRHSIAGVSKKQRGSAPLKAILAALSSALVIAGGYTYSAVGTLNNDLAQADNLNLGHSTDGAMDILLTGVDSRTDAKGNPLSQEEIDMLRAGEEEVTNTDTMILIRIPDDGASATAVSIPRDTYVHTDDLGNTKLNGVYGQMKELTKNKMENAGITNEDQINHDSTEAGRRALIEAIAGLTGITVDHYAEVGLLGFVLLTDAVGGVPVCLNNPVNEPLSGAHFPAGEQTLHGPDALSFVRQRHDLPRGDLDRITRQQAYMASLASKVLSSGTLTNPSKLNALNNAVQRSVVIDSDWDIMSMAKNLQNLSGGNITFQTIPVTSINGTGDYGESVVTVDQDQVHTFFRELAGEEEPTPSAENSYSSNFRAKDYQVSVLNASNIEGLATRVSEIVEDKGYSIAEVGNYSETGISESQVNAADTKSDAARALADLLGGIPVVHDSNLGEKELTVTLSGTYDGPGYENENSTEESATYSAPHPSRSSGAQGSGAQTNTLTHAYSPHTPSMMLSGLNLNGVIEDTAPAIQLLASVEELFIRAQATNAQITSAQATQAQTTKAQTSNVYDGQNEDSLNDPKPIVAGDKGPMCVN